VSTEQELILASCCLSPVKRNSVLDELRVKRSAVIHEETLSILKASKVGRIEGEEELSIISIVS